MISRLGIVILGVAWGIYLMSWITSIFMNWKRRGATIIRHPYWRKYLILTTLLSVFLIIIFQDKFLKRIPLDPFLESSISFIGITSLLIGLSLSLWAKITLGASWSPSPSVLENHSIIKSGPYSFVRHPIYTGTILMLIGSSGFIRLYILIPLVLLMIILYVGKAIMEEQILCKTIGNEYNDYRKEVPMFIPKIICGRL